MGGHDADRRHKRLNQADFEGSATDADSHHGGPPVGETTRPVSRVDLPPYSRGAAAAMSHERTRVCLSPAVPEFIVLIAFPPGRCYLGRIKRAGIDRTQPPLAMVDAQGGTHKIYI